MTPEKQHSMSYRRPAFQAPEPPWPKGMQWQIKDVARYLGISYRHARLLLVKGKITCVDVGAGKGKQALRTSLRHIKQYLHGATLRPKGRKPRSTYKYIDPSKSGRG